MSEELFLDAHGNSYKTIKIAGKTWMAENLKYSGKLCFPISSSNENITKNYGCLYSWEEAQKVCPAGWHLPNKDDLFEFSRFCHERLKSSEEDFSFYGEALRDLNLRPAGWFLNEKCSFEGFGECLYLWGEDHCSIEFMEHYSEIRTLVGKYRINESVRFSVRYVKD